MGGWHFERPPIDQSRAASMYFWSVSWSTNCPVYFSFLFVDQKKLSSLRPNKKFFVSLWSFFGQSLIFFVHPLLERLTKQNSETDQNFFVQSLRLDNFFWLTKKMRNRPDNWLTKRLTKSTWTPLRCSNQSHGLVYMALLQITMPARPI